MIRLYARKVGHTVIGKLTRHCEYEKNKTCKFYLDEANNEYWVTDKGVCIVTCDGGII